MELNFDVKEAKLYQELKHNLILCSFHDVIDELLFEKKINIAFNIFNERTYTIYSFKEIENTFIVHAPESEQECFDLLNLLFNLKVENVFHLTSFVKSKFDFGFIREIFSENELLKYFSNESHLVNDSPLFLDLVNYFNDKHTGIIELTNVIQVPSKYIDSEDKESVLLGSSLLALAKKLNKQYIEIGINTNHLLGESLENNTWIKHNDIRRDILEIICDWIKEKRI